jgi:MerR family transcriptional regulator, light-induced transcriptional regulator
MDAMGFSIKELESLSGIKAHTIRIWEQRYKFLKPSRTLTNIRTYSNEELKTLLTVALLNKHGYKISRIDNMRPDQRRQEVLHLSDAEARNEQLVNDLIGAMIDLDFIQFEALLTQHISQQGLYTAISGVIFQFLQKVGILWQTNRIHPAHEHVASCIVRQKLISAIDQLPPASKAKPLFLLFLPEAEHHELGLLFVYYLLKERGLPVLYLGANVP